MIILIILVLYTIVLLGIGVWAKSRNRSEKDFLVGGRQLGPWVASLSYAASTSSAWALLGFTGFVYAVGLSALWIVPGVWIGYAVVWLLMGPSLRAESDREDYVTPTAFVLGGGSGKARNRTAILASLLIAVCFIFYIAAQFDAAGKAFIEHFPVDLEQAVIVGAAVILVYSFVGGFWAVSLTDMLQAFVMLAVALLTGFMALVELGGFAAMVETLRETAPPEFLSIRGSHAGLMLFGFIAGTLGITLGAFGQPQLLVRLMALKDDRSRRSGFLILLTWGVLIYIGLSILGLAGRALFPDIPDGEALLYTSADRLLPSVLAGIAVAATLSAVMSTADSILLSASAALAHDTGLNRRFPGRELLVSRLAVLGITVLAVFLTLMLPDSIFNRVLFAWSALGAAFGPIMFFRVFGKQVSMGASALAMLLGFGTTLLFYSAGAVAGPSDSLLVYLAKLPGDPFERLFPWVPGVLVLFLHRMLR